MKKILLLAVTAVFSTGLYSQGPLTSKSGAVILPEAGDWSLSLDGAPIFRFIGNSFNGNLNNNNMAAQSTVGGNTILIRKFITDKTAYRATFGVNINRRGATNEVVSDAQTTPVVFPALPDMVTDEAAETSTNITLGFGKEWRVGDRRLQGFYGADAILGFGGGGRTSYTYGNEMSDTTIPAAGITTTPMSTTWVGTYPNGISAKGTRTLSSKNGTTVGLGIRGFIGADYFVFPKIAIGFEYGWGFSFSMTGQGTTVTETTGGSPTQAAEQETKTGKRSNIGVNNDINGGQIRISFFF